MQASFRALETLKTKYRHAARAVDDSFQATKNLFEKHNVVFTVAGGLLSAGAAWAGYSARQIHQKKLEEKLQKIEEHMTNVYSLEEQQVKALTSAAARTGVSYKTFFATSSTALIVGYALGFRGGRRFVIRHIPPDLLLAAKKQRSNNRLSRFLPGKGEPTTESPGPIVQPNAAATSSGQSDAQTEPVNETNAASSTRTEAEGLGGDEPSSDKSTGNTSQSDRQEQEPPANVQSSMDPEKDRDKHRVASRDRVDAALGETGFERQFERVMRPEREAIGESSEALDDILHATIPNLNGRIETDALEDEVAASNRDVGRGTESEQSEPYPSSRQQQGEGRGDAGSRDVTESSESQSERREEREKGESGYSQAAPARVVEAVEKT